MGIETLQHSMRSKHGQVSVRSESASELSHSFIFVGTQHTCAAFFRKSICLQDLLRSVYDSVHVVLRNELYRSTVVQPD